MLFHKDSELARAEVSRRLKVLAWTLFGAEESDAVVVGELRFTEPGCPPVETVLALLRPGGHLQVKIDEPLLDVVESDVREAFLADEHARHDS